MSSSFHSKKPVVALISLGCPKNLVDSEIMLGLLDDGYYRISPRWGEADVIIINTCAFLKSARREAQEEIKKAVAWKQSRGGKLVITGCLVQYYGDEAADIFPGADILLGVGEYGALPNALDRCFSGEKDGPRLKSKRTPRFPFHRSPPRRVSTPRHLAYLRVADGCDNRCTYCLIPGLRGPYQERPLSAILSEARHLVDQGVREIILIAQDTAYYGYNHPKPGGLALLLEALNEIAGLDWIRILYAHPSHIDTQLLQTMADCDKICPYLDIPLQHINDSILAKMGRKIDRERIERVLEQARELVEGVSLRTTLMVGFPGEGEEEFTELVDFVRSQRFDHLGVFTYSPEKGTAAWEYGEEVDGDCGLRRRDQLMEIQQAISTELLQALRGEEVTVLVDGQYPEPSSSLMIGRGTFQAPEIDGVVVIEGKEIRPGDMVQVKITGSSEYDLYGVK